MSYDDHFQAVVTRSSNPQRRTSTLWISAFSLAILIVLVVLNDSNLSHRVSLETRRQGALGSRQHSTAFWGILFQNSAVDESVKVTHVARKQSSLAKQRSKPTFHQKQKILARKLKSWLDMSRSYRRKQVNKTPSKDDRAQEEDSHFTSKLEMSVAGFMAQQAASRMTGQPPRPIMGIGANGFVLSIDAGRGRYGDDMQATSDSSASGL
mmetsp:Transcript_52062/g.161898  ORF Transcript_52062/g.161898 Transcript_52062/m.161898 type:complete len:209 (+) Transcript_52062:165-791(+)